MRSKEEAHDYRYFPDPDLVPVVVDRDWVEAVRETLPELPDAARKRLVQNYGLPEYDATVLTLTKDTLDFFDRCMEEYHDAKVVSNWIMGELNRLLNQQNLEITECKVTPFGLVSMLRLIDEGTISGKMAKSVFEEMFATGKQPEVIIKEKGMVQISDESALEPIIARIVADNPKVVEDYRNGKDKAFGFFVGQVMKATRGQANPKMVNDILKRILSGA